MSWSDARSVPWAERRVVMRFGIGLPHFGDAPKEIGIGPMARSIEAADFDVWFSDHVVLIEEPASRYPFSASGEFFVAANHDWYDFVTTAAYVAEVVTRAQMGVGVSVAALRNPVEFAKQLATLDRLAGGGFIVGVGAGWLREEFEALGVPSEQRGRRLEHVIDMLQAVWTGAPPAGEHGPYALPAGVRAHPRPVAGTMPILMGGNSPATFRRVVTHADGWLGMAPGGSVEAGAVHRVVGELRRHCDTRDRDPAELEVALRYGVSGRLLATPNRLEDDLLRLVEEGVTSFVFDIGWASLVAAEDRLGGLRDVCNRVGDSANATNWRGGVHP